MERLNSGDKIEIWNQTKGWISFRDAYLTEATEYKLRYSGNPINIRFQGISIPFYKEQDYFVTTWMTPFQSGILTIDVEGQQYNTYIYSDNRKLTMEQYNLMLKDIMNESRACFQLSGLEIHVDAVGKSRDISWTQWSYIEENFHQLRQIFSRIEQQPIRQLEKKTIMMKREKVQRAQNETLRWLDRQGHGKDIPKNVQSVRTFETNNVYENQIVKQQLIDFFRLLEKYELMKLDAISQKAKQFTSIIQRWINGAFLTAVKENKRPYTITQRFRKHPVYRGWYQWFDRLYNHKHEGIGLSYPIPLKDTFQLYEIWCYMMVVKVLRELDYVESTSGIYKIQRNSIFLDLAGNKESNIDLKNNNTLYFQRLYQNNTKNYYTYTQRMIPDIVIEGEYGIIVFDPKYRVADNLGTALGEMHKYKDGIIHRGLEERAVQQVFILTPTGDDEAESMRYFDKNFYKKYRMGAIKLMPGECLDGLKENVKESIKLLSKK